MSNICNVPGSVVQLAKQGSEKETALSGGIIEELGTGRMPSNAAYYIYAWI